MVSANELAIIAAMGSDREEMSSKRPKVAADMVLDQFCSPAVVCSSDMNELDAYLADTVSPVSFADILEWWKKAEQSYPKLANIAWKYLAVPATSAASESAFWYAGLTITDLRN